MPATKHTYHAPSMKTECDYLYDWIKTRPRDIARNAEEEVEEDLNPGLRSGSLGHRGGFTERAMMARLFEWTDAAAAGMGSIAQSVACWARCPA